MAVLPTQTDADGLRLTFSPIILPPTPIIHTLIPNIRTLIPADGLRLTFRPID